MASESNSKQQAQDGRADFDFFMGSWKIRNRNLPKRLVGSTAWEEFEGTTVARKILGGLGHIEEFTMERASGATEGMAVRLFDPQTQQWSVYAANNRNGFDPRPAIGAFKEGRFEGYSHEPWEGSAPAYGSGPTASAVLCAWARDTGPVRVSGSGINSRAR